MVEFIGQILSKMLTFAEFKDAVLLFTTNL